MPLIPRTINFAKNMSISSRRSDSRPSRRQKDSFARTRSWGREWTTRNRPSCHGCPPEDCWRGPLGRSRETRVLHVRKVLVLPSCPTIPSHVSRSISTPFTSAVLPLRFRFFLGSLSRHTYTLALFTAPKSLRGIASLVCSQVYSIARHLDISSVSTLVISLSIYRITFLDSRSSRHTWDMVICCICNEPFISTV